MANHCISISHPEIQELAKITKQHPAIVAAKAAIWQEKNNTLDRFPTSEELRSSNQVNYSLKAVDILISDKAKQVFEKGIKNNWPLDKILTELQVPKEQKELILDLGKTNREEIALDLAANYSYSVEINTTKEQGLKNQKKGFDLTQVPDTGRWVVSNFQTGIPKYFDIKEDAEKYIKGEVEETPTQHYSNLTVPGGTNYTENEIATPAITPSIKGHAQFATDNGIGWFRSDDKENKVVGWKKEDDFLNSETAQYNPITKDDKIIFGHPTIGKSYLKQKGNNDFITLDDDYANEVNVFIDNNRGSETRQEYKGRKPKEYNEFMLSLFDRLKLQAKKEGKKLFVSNTNILKERMSEFDKVITIPKDEFKKRFDARGATYGFEDWKSDIDITVAKVDKSKVISTTGYLSDLLEGNPKTRRILEVQSDLFQKGRDKEDLINKEPEHNYTAFPAKNFKNNKVGDIVMYKGNYYKLTEKYLDEIDIFNFDNKGDEDLEMFKIELVDAPDNNQNNFLQLLNKNNNWVTFFIKSIIQDSAKKGYEKVLFPSGNTASKVEGHATLEEFKKQKEDRIKFLDGEINDPENIERRIEEAKREREQIKQELERIETEGFGALKPIYNFYENTVTNILNKTYGKENIKKITDEYGNTWNEVTLDETKASDLLFQTKDSSKSILEKALPELDKYLLDFLKDFGVKSKEFEELKSKLGIDALGATDVLNKLIWYVKDRNAETVPEEVGHMIVMLMGETNPIIAELLDNISSWSEFAEISAEYTSIYKNEKQVRIEAIGKLIAKALVKNYKLAGVDKSIINRLLDSLMDILNSILKKFNFGQALFFNEHLADKIALNVLAGNKNFVANLNTIHPKVDYEKTLGNNQFAKAIINTFTSSKFNAKLTGSIAIAGQNEHIYRLTESPIHDLDFQVNSTEDYNRIVETLKELKAEPIHYGWSNAQKDYETQAWFIPAAGFKIEIVKRDFQRGNGWVEEYKLYDLHGNQVEPNDANITAVDFFVHKHGVKNTNSVFTSVSNIYFGKLTLSPIGNNERLFQREKDQQDYILHKPVNVSESRSEFIYFQTKANVNPAIDKKLEDAVNKNIDNLTQRIAELMPLRGGDSAQSAKINIFKLKDKLRELSEERTYEKLAEVAYYQLEEAKRILKDPNLSAFELNEVKRIITYTQNFDAYLQDAPKDLQEKKKNIRDLNVALNVQFQEKLLEALFSQSKVTGLEYSKEELDKAYVDVSGIEAGTLAPEYSPIPLAKLIGRSIDLMNRKTSEDFNTDFKDELNKLLKELGKKKFETSDFSEIMEDNKLILEFSSKYFKDEKELWAKHSKLLNEYKKDDKLKSQVADSFNQIFKWYKDNLDYYITSESIKKYKEDLADFKKAFLNSNGEEDARTAEAVQKWQAVNSPYLMLGYTEDENGDQTIDIDPEGKVKIVAERLASTKIGDKYYKNDNWHKYLKARPRPQYLNPKWAKASKNPLHIFMLEKYVEAIKMLPRKVAADIGNYHRFLDNFSLEVTASDNRLKKLVSGIKNISEETFKIQVNQAMVDGGIIKKIVKSDGTIEEEFKPLLRTKDERGNPKPQITHKTIENIKKTQQFKDPMEILQEFYKQAVTYRHKTVVAPVLDLLQYKVETTPGISTNMINQILLDAQGNPQLIENGLINTSGQTRYAINSALSGITRTDSNLGAGVSKAQKEKLKELTDAWVAGGMQGPAPTVSVLSKVKVSDALVDYTRMSLIGLKPFTAATNLMLGLMNNYVYAARGKEFTEKNLDVATKLLFGNVFKFITSKTISSDVKKISNLAEKFGITNTLYESQDPDVAIRAKNKFVKFLFSLQEGGEFLIANQTMIAMMLNAKITSKEGKSSSLWDAYNEEGNLKPEFQTREWSSVEVINDKGDNVSKLNQFRNSLDKIRKRTQGDYQSPMKVKGDWYGRIIMMFRTWVPQAIKERFGRENEDFKGRYTSYADVFSKSFKEDGFKGLFETLGKFSLTTLAKMTNILPLGKYRFDKLDNSAKAAFDEYLDKIGASELDVENMRANIKELQFFLTCTIMILGISGLKGDDDDQTSNFLINIMYRLRQDLTAFVSPGSALSVIKDPLPIMKTIKDVQDVLGTSWDYLDKPESRYYQKGYNKGDLKVWKELQDLLPIYSAVNSTQGVLNTVFNSDSYKYAK